MADELFDVRNNFYLGSYQAAINAASTLAPSDPNVKADMDALVFRSYAALVRPTPPSKRPNVLCVCCCVLLCVVCVCIYTCVYNVCMYVCITCVCTYVV